MHHSGKCENTSVDYYTSILFKTLPYILDDSNVNMHGKFVNKMWKSLQKCVILD